MVVVRQRVTRLRRNLRRLAFHALPLGLALPTALLPHATPLAAILAAWGLVGVVVAWRQNRAPSREEVDVVVDGATVRCGAEVIPATDVRSATRRWDVLLGPIVELRLPRWRVWRIAVADDPQARLLLAALRADVSHRRATFTALSPIDGAPLLLRWALMIVPGTLIPLVVLALWGWTSPWSGLVAGLCLVAFVTAYAPRRIDVGSDGIVLRWLWRQRFLPIADIERVEMAAVHGRELIAAALHLRDGTIEQVPIERSSEGPVETDRLVERIRDAQQLGGDPIQSAALSVLARGGRSPLAWVGALRGLAAGALADHRTAAVPSKSYAAIVRGARSSPVSRAAAAVVLARSPGAEAAALVEAATSSADPALRVALARAAEADASDESLAEALALLEASEEKRSARAFLG